MVSALYVRFSACSYAAVVSDEYGEVKAGLDLDVVGEGEVAVIPADDLCLHNSPLAR